MKRRATFVEPEGGETTTAYGRVKMEFPAEAISEPVQVRVRAPRTKVRPPFSLSGQPLEIRAKGRHSGEEVEQFQAPVTVTVVYDPDRVHGDEEDLTLFAFDQESQAWRPLPTQVDTATGALTAQVEGPAIIDYDVENWEAARLPSLAAFQTAPFTGAASYSLPLEVPPGPGGLQPSLMLTYNSQVVDSATNETQASWVGMGWSLDTGYIQRNKKGTIDRTEDDTFSLNVAGVSSMLLRGDDGYYHTTDENFWRIKYEADDDLWIVWDKSGTQYIFDHQAQYPEYYHKSGPGKKNYRAARTWRWSLVEIRNIFGQSLTFSYATETKKVWNVYDLKQFNMSLAVYPKEIRYPHGRYRILFVREDDRQDHKLHWANGEYSRVLFERSRLVKIRVEHDTDGDGQFEQLIHEYVFTYESDPEKHIFPGVVWDAGGRTPTLVKVQEFGADGIGLPPTTFTYGDHMHLTEADNGYGGRVQYSYETWHDTDTPKGDTIDHYYDDQRKNRGTCRHHGYNGGWQGVDNESSAKCKRHKDDETGEWKVGIVRLVGEVYNQPRRAIFRPGGVYYFRAELTATSAQIGYNDGSGPVYFEAQPLDRWRTFETTFTLPTSARQARVLIKCLVGSGDLHKFVLRQLPTRYRVVEKRIYDGLNPEPQVFAYRYDEAAMNNETHSQVIKNIHERDRYVGAYTEFRGHAMVQELGPDGRVGTTWFHQDDARKGQAHTTTITTQSFWDAFDALDSAACQYTHPNTQQTIERLRGDKAFKCHNPNADWSVQVQRTEDSIRDEEGFSNAVITQFRFGETQNKGKAWPVLALEGPTAFWRWGIVISSNGAGGYKLEAQYNENNGPEGWQYQHLTSDFSPDTWYVLEMVVDDDNEFMTRVWERDNPGAVWHYQRKMPEKLNWHFKQWTRAGTLWLDTYSEGRLYNETATLYQTKKRPVGKLPHVPGDKNQVYRDLRIYWTRTEWEKSLVFEGRANWVGRLAEYQYDPDYQGGGQYGNVTRIIEKAWQGDRFVPYRASQMQYYPTVTDNAYLVGLPGYRNQYQCSPSAACDHRLERLLTSTWYLYDNQTRFYDPPTAGKLTGQRTLLRFAGPGPTDDPRYSDELYSYDAWGNRTGLTRFTGEGTYEALASEGAQQSLIFYDDVYHTYPVTTINALGHVSYKEYDYALGLAVKEIDPNGAIGTAEYDGFGRLRQVRKPGDEEGEPTVQIVYYDHWFPLLVDIHRKPAETAPGNVSVRKFYDGAGRLIQVQTPRAQLGQAQCDIVVDYQYDAYGRVIRQTVPYDIEAWHTGLSETPYRGRQLDRPSTLTTCDVQGRPSTVTATDGTQAKTIYTPLKTISLDPLGRTTVTRRDVWGRTTEVIPLLPPTASYEYDALDRLVRVTSGGGETTIWYDQAGRKLGMRDADMGQWAYTYDALGNLRRQTDARGQRICLYYDSLNRLIGKHYRRDDEVLVDPPLNVTYDYDGESRQDIFDGNALPADWEQNGNITVGGRQIHVVGNDTWSTFIGRTETVASPHLAHFAFRLDRDDAVANLFWHSGAYGQEEYRRWGLVVTNGHIQREIFIGKNVDLTPLMSFKANVWYEALLIVDGVERFRVQVWERDNPSVNAALAEARSDWVGRTWTFRNHVHTGQEDFADYMEQPLGTWQIGRRVAMNDASGATAWEYDTRGRVIAEKKTIKDAGTFVTQWGYDSNDRPAWMQYPGGSEGQAGEKIEYRYHPHGPLNQVFSDLETYVQRTDYAACGRIKRQLPGSGTENRGVLQSVFDYYPWEAQPDTGPGNSQGRLRAIQRGPVDGRPLLQDLHYTYDPVGNILNVQDQVAQQTQAFAYDELDRIISAEAFGGEAGQYEENYAYNQLGLLVQKGEKAYAYQDPKHVHAVTHWGEFGKTITIRAKGTLMQDVRPHTIQAEGVPVEDARPHMQLWVNRRMIHSWKVDFAEFAEYRAEAVLSGRDEIALVFTTDHYMPSVKDRLLIVDWIQVGEQLFEAEGPDVIYDRGDPFDNQDVTAGREGMWWQGSLRLTVETAPATFSYDANGNMERRIIGNEEQRLIYDAEKRMVAVEQNGQRLAEFVYDGDGNRVKGTVNGVTTMYPCDHYEVQGDTVKQYYTAGGRGIAMRENRMLYWLLTDHLGSTAVTSDAGGNKKAELRYRAFGETRYEQGSTPTSYRYTGQRQEFALGLHYFRARWYDPLLGNFTQADSIIPSRYGPLSLARFTYAFNNPLKYIDPSGHDSTDVYLKNKYVLLEDTGLYSGNSGKGIIDESVFGITFKGDWDIRDKASAYKSLHLIATAMADAYPATTACSNNMVFGDLVCNAVPNDPYELFREVFGGQTMEFSAQRADGFFGRRIPGGVRFYSNARGRISSQLVVHEMGHAFNAIIANQGRTTPYNDLNETWKGIPDFPRRDPDNIELRGYFGRRFGWQQSAQVTVGEEFADMFIGWTYSRWEASSAGRTRANWMTTNMAEWILRATVPSYGR